MNEQVISCSDVFVLKEEIGLKQWGVVRGDEGKKAGQERAEEEGRADAKALRQK